MSDACQSLSSGAGTPSSRKTGPGRGRPGSSGSAGLTLVEVLVALAILGVSAAVLMTATSRCLSVVRVAKNYYEARRILELGDLEHPLLVVKEKSGTVLKDKAINLNVGPIEYPNGFVFSRASERKEDQDDLVVVRTKVSWSVRGKSAFEEVTTYLYYTNDITM
jgi:prepilin-type N-terminal cleavage/methylation domain-containing protein